MKKKVIVLTLSARLFAFGPIRSGLCLLGAILLGFSLPAAAQQPKKIPRVGILSLGAGSADIDAFRQGLRKLGYVEGQTSPLNTDGRREMKTGFQLLRLNCST